MTISAWIEPFVVLSVYKSPWMPKVYRLTSCHGYHRRAR